uniref:AMP-dependent synthetase/ligase domain-containing protein n=1 Tax=Arcella intermedia TaxID=1963864 RepID=A0A6B2LPA2_9EUKA
MACVGGYVASRYLSYNVSLDYKVLPGMISGMYQLKTRWNKKLWGFVDDWDDIVQRNLNRVCFRFIDNDDSISYTYKEVDEVSNQVANAFKADGLNYGECVALLMENKPEFIFTWLGIAKAGGITAFINTNQSGKTLLHSFVTCKAQ